jgi:hypothetical protein
MFFKKMRQLRAEIKELRGDNFFLRDNAKVLEGEHKKHCTNLLGKLKAEQKEVEHFKDLCKKTKSELNKLKNLVRDQTRADLLFNALKGLGIIKDSLYDHFAEERRLITKQEKMENIASDIRHVSPREKLRP